MSPSAKNDTPSSFGIGSLPQLFTDVVPARLLDKIMYLTLIDLHQLLRRMREVGAAWRGIFSRVEASAKRTSNGVLGVASLVQVRVQDYNVVRVRWFVLPPACVRT